MQRTKLGSTMEGLTILAQIGEVDFVGEMKGILRNAYSKEVQEACKYLNEEEKMELLCTI